MLTSSDVLLMILPVDDVSLYFSKRKREKLLLN